MSPTTTKMENSYEQDDIGAMMDKKIKTLEKHLEIAEKEATIAELENKKKQLDEEWAIEKFGQHGLDFEHILLTCLKDQDIELRTLKHEKQRIIDHLDQIIENYDHHHKELRAEKEKLNEQIQQKDEELKQKDKAMAKLRDLIADMISGASKKNKELEQKEKVAAKLKDLTAEIVSGASKLNDLLAEQDEELQEPKTQVSKEKVQLDSTTKIGKMKPRWKDENVKKKEFLPNEEVGSVNGARRSTGNSSCHRGPSRAAWPSLTTEPGHRGTDSATWLAGGAPVRGGPRRHRPGHCPGRRIRRWANPLVL